MLSASIQEAKQIDLAAIVEDTGVKLATAGPGRLRGLCPFHQEDTPSFFIFENRRWHCFGCGEHGDSIDFVRKARGCSFPEALSVLGVDDPKRTAAELARIKAERQRREALKWSERETIRSLGHAIRISHRILERITPETLDQFALVLDQLPIINYQHDILTNGDPDERAELLHELAGLRLLPRRLLFRRDFDFSAWSRSVSGAPKNDRRPTGATGDSDRTAVRYSQV